MRCFSLFAVVAQVVVVAAVTLGCPASDAQAAPARPATAPVSEPVVAHLLFVQGGMQVQPAAGAPFAAAAGHDLVTSDRLDPAVGAFAVLVLQNNHVVRVDDVGPLGVGQIALLRAPASTMDVTIQLQRLVDASEGVNVQGVTERAAAWRHGPRAAESNSSRGRRQRAEAAPAAAAPMPALADDEADDRAAEEGPAGGARSVDGVDGVDGVEAKKEASRVTSSRESAKASPPAPARPMPAPAPSASASKDAIGSLDGLNGLDGLGSVGGVRGVGGTTGTGAGAGKGLGAGASGRTQKPADQPASAPQTVLVRLGATLADTRQATPTPASAQFAAVLDNLDTCRAVDAASQTAAYILRVRSGRIVTVAVDGALPVPACARAWRGRVVDVADGLIVVPAP